MDKFIDMTTGRVAVLYSPGFGAGWSTWSASEAAIFHPTIVQWVLDGKPDPAPDVAALFGDEHIYTGGMYDLTVQWLEPGTKFRIEEYDGSESVQVMDATYWITA